MDIGENVNEVNGVNLDDYVPYERNCDTILYVHKRVINEEAEEEKVKKAKKKKKDKIKKQTSNGNERTNNESVLEQTVRFAKHLAPVVIPPNEGSDTPIFYTIETCSKCRKTNKKPKEIQSDDTYEKKSRNKVVETYRYDRKSSRKHSITESLTHSSQNNTLDDININQSLNGTISEQSNKRDKYVKNEFNSKRKRNKCVISESFEAVATEFADADDTKIKIQLMNSAEKNAFCDSIKSPLMDAVRECISEIDNNEVREEIKTVQRKVKSNSDKLDEILDRLTYIEKYMQNIEYAKTNAKSPRYCVKSSTLEQLGEDIDDEKCYDEELDGVIRNKRLEDNRVENMGCGELVNVRASSSVGVKTERPNRIPARYCWTDANKD